MTLEQAIAVITKALSEVEGRLAMHQTLQQALQVLIAAAKQAPAG